MSSRLTLSLLPHNLAVCRLQADSKIPEWATISHSFISITRTSDELSIVCQDDIVPTDVQAERRWKIFKVEGPLDFSLTGVLFKILQPLADANVSIFALSTYDTDYIMVKEEKLEQAKQLLSNKYRVQVLE
ncbi:GATS-like protein 2 [Trichoplax sp. H2]|nr:GATS-like protein 2 [Trichoplax sp. H2]|eukprot:RDD44003.1 GATS-like protein 2 [Trichoplax sp. H2]